MRTLLLHPQDVLFFRDGRPMSGSSSGKGAAWPLPHTVNAALHAALRRSGLEDPEHRFTTAKSVGPFPVAQTEGKATRWYFPRPLDAQKTGSPVVTHRPDFTTSPSSLPAPLCAVPRTNLTPNKKGPEPWMSAEAWRAYLSGDALNGEDHLLRDAAIFKPDHRIGIGIDPATGTQNGEQFYSAQYLALRPTGGWCLGMLAEAAEGSTDFLGQLIGTDRHITVGGQQRVCSADLFPTGRELPLPVGLVSDFSTGEVDGKKRWLVKWVLLTPAIWPVMRAGESRRQRPRQAHPGGWLPNWIDPVSGAVLLCTVPAEERRARRNDRRLGHGYDGTRNASSISARLVAAMTGKPLVVTGWSLTRGEDDPEGGAKSTHLAVPAGAVYFFTADSPQDAQNLAAALNWHGGGDATTVRRRRSTLCGEKGFGLGVCGSWEFFAL